MSGATFRSLPWRSKWQHDLAAKSCPAHNFVIWSRILKIFHKNDHYIETACHAQHLGRYLEGQGHSITLQPKSCLAHFTTISQNLGMLVIVLGDFNKIPHALSDILLLSMSLQQTLEQLWIKSLCQKIYTHVFTCQLCTSQTIKSFGLESIYNH